MPRRAISFFMVALFASALFPQRAFAGAWTLPQYHVYTEYYMKWNYAKEEFLSNGKKRKLSGGVDARSWEFVQEPKLEYGITDYLNALFSFEYKESHYKEYGRPATWGSFAHKNNGVSSVKLGGKWRLIENPFVFSTQGRVFIYPGYGNFHGDDPAFNNQPSIGRGDDAFEWRALFGKSFTVKLSDRYKLPAYVGAETGYRWRTRSVCNDIPYFIEAGFWPVDWFLIKSELDGYKSHPGTGSVKENYGIWRIGGVWQVFGNSQARKDNKIFNIEFQYGMTLYGKNTAAYQEWVLKVVAAF